MDWVKQKRKGRKMKKGQRNLCYQLQKWIGCRLATSTSIVLAILAIGIPHMKTMKIMIQAKDMREFLRHA